jgi:hypothetical protein
VPKKYLRKMKISIALLLFIYSCNPVKQVLSDRAKFDEVAKEVIRAGYCANDTVIVSKSDTTVLTDTVNNYFIDTEVRNDTVYQTRIENKIVTKKVTIRDTVRQVVTDNARVSVLEADKRDLSMKVMEWKDKATDRLKWLVLLLVGIGLWIFFKIKP